MSKLVKSAVLGVGLLAGTALAAQAQSVSSIPPTTNSPAASVPTQPYTSTQTIVPDPGGSVKITSQHYQGAKKSGPDLVDHPYSTSIDSAKSGPKPN
jgi:hypothetical protein